MRRFAFAFLIAVFPFLLSFHSVHAAGEFSISYDITYEVGEEGKAFVVSDISLTNKLSQVYATEYTLEIANAKIANIGAWDSRGEIKTDSAKEGDSTRIHITFNDQVVGLGKTLRFTLKYEILDFAKKNGEIWEFTVPKLGKEENLQAVNLTLKVPHSFPALAFISPKPQNSSQTDKFSLFSFSQETARNGIVAAFGDFQVFDFEILYHLSNSKISLPPDTSYQQVFYSKIEPEPVNVEIDEDGNWLASFKVKPLTKLEVKVSGYVKIAANPVSLPASISSLSSINNLYLSSQPFWEVNDPEIQKLAKELKTPERIFDFVVKTLNYDFTRVGQKPERRGAAAALNNPQNAICMEFTDLFIALSRAVGIPARELNGFAYTDNPKLKPLGEKADVLHAWPEYFDRERNLWVQVDPTWEKTSQVDYYNKLDLSHFVFAIHGKDSQLPPAAGSYKDEKGGKDIRVEFGKYQEEKNSQLSAQFLFPEKIFWERGGEGEVILENKGPAAIYSLPLSLKTQDLKAELQDGSTISVLPPFGKKTLGVKIAPAFSSKGGKTALTLLAGDTAFEYNIVTESLVLSFALPILSGGFAVIVIIFLARKSGRLPLQG